MSRGGGRPQAVGGMTEAAYYHPLSDGRVVCDLCPHHCTLAEGQAGICRSRVHRGGRLWAMSYGHPCALAVDPIEKKPIARWHPGTECLSIACTGCNFRCLNCQNYAISQVSPDEVESGWLSPADIVRLARRYGQHQIAYTYTEPLTWFEYLRDTASLARESGMSNILVSAGYVEREPLEELLPLLDAANIDLKSFSDDLYRTVNGGHLQPVLHTLRRMREAGIWLEITLLVIPGVNDDGQMCRAMCQWLADNGFARTPLHLTRFFPQYKMADLQPTPVATLKAMKKIAEEEGIRTVLLGNVGTEEAVERS